MQDETNSNTANSQTILPGRFLGLLARDDSRDKGFLFLVNAEQEYFAHKSGWAPITLFYNAAVDQAFSFRVTKTSKGPRAWDIRRPTEDEQADVIAMVADYRASRKAIGQRQQEIAVAAAGTAAAGGGRRHRPVRRQIPEDSADVDGE
jgi:hypothetical protein